MLDTIRKLFRKSNALRTFITKLLLPTGILDRFLLQATISPAWHSRIALALKSPDNEKIARVPNSGRVMNGTQLMHNGLRIHVGSYYGPEIAQLLSQNKGVHEPQEELVFGAILNAIPPRAVMIELGAYWGFYSMWFASSIKESKNYLIEPDSFNLAQGKRNFKLNKLTGDFKQAFVGMKSTEKSEIPTVSVFDFASEKKLDFIDVLHSDIQGYEVEMLLGCEGYLKEGKIGYFFISTHSNTLHDQCIKILKDNNYLIIAACNLDESYSEDGLIVAKKPSFPGPDQVTISLRTGGRAN